MSGIRGLTRGEIDGELADAKKSPRLNQWEQNFVASIAGAKVDYELTPAQRLKWRQIEEKIYAPG